MSSFRKNKRKKTIKSILTRSIVIHLVATVATLGVIFIVSVYQILKGNTINELVFETKYYKTILENRLNSTGEQLKILGRNHFIVNALVNQERNSRNLEKLLADYTEDPFIKSITVVDSEEKVVYSVGDKINFAELGLYLTPVIEEGNFYFSYSSQGASFFVSAPILYYNTPQGALIFQVELESLFTQLGNLENVEVGLELDGTNVFPKTNFDSYLEMEEVIESPFVNRSILYLKANRNKVIGPTLQFITIYLIFFIVFVFITILIIRRLSRKLANPFYQLSELIQNKRKIDELKHEISDESLETGLVREAFYKTNKELYLLNQNLESSVKQRTEELNLTMKDFEFYKNSIYSATIVLETDTQGNITACNDNFLQKSKFSINEVSEKNARIVNSGYHPREFWSEMWQTILNGNIWRGEINNKDKLGETYWVDSFIIPRKDSNGKVVSFLSIQNDITQRKTFEKQMLQEKSRAEKATVAKSEFLAKMSHEIRTPMNVVLGMTSLLKDTDLSNEQNEYVDSVSISAENLLTIINDILDYSKLEANKIVINKHPIDLLACIKHSVSMFKYQAIEKTIDLKCNISEDTPKFVVGDEIRLGQILINLIGNAVKFTNEGSVTLNVTTQGIDTNKLKIEFEVLDTGIGVSQEGQQNLFKEFHQGDNLILNQYGGSGLGLAISKKLVGLMGGEISFKSSLHKGTTFIFSVIVETALDSGAEEDKAQKFTSAAFDNESLNILVVEDKVLNQKVAIGIFSRIGLDIEIASDGLEAIEKTKNNRYDYIFMDLFMPKMNGIEASKKILEIDKNVTIIALTANAFQEDRDACFAAGMKDFLAKPIRKRDLIKVLDRHISKKDHI